MKTIKIELKNRIEWRNEKGQFHRNGDHPAVIWKTTGTIKFYKNGKRHRTNGPAIMSPYQSEWWIHGIRHRLDGPAIESAHGEAWYINGKLHRIEGPAYTYRSFPFPSQYSTEEWFVNGLRHRDNDLPAIISNNAQEWFLNGNHHRENNQPAILNRFGYTQWFVNGKHHREDGPAIEHVKGNKFFLKGKQIFVESQEEFEKYMKLPAFH